mgnify:CR=1 FL=1
MRYDYNKLVRDKIPEEINKIEGRKANYKILDEEEYQKELDKKLFEEAHEFVEEHSIEELADLMEVINAEIKVRNINYEDIEEVRKIKAEKKGKFENKIYLNYVEQDYIDKKEEEESKKEWRKLKKYNIITLCGSINFKDEFLKVQEKLVLKGNIVFTPNFFDNIKKEEISLETKEMLDKMHKQKIDMSDEIYVINQGGYIGESTKLEIEYAKSKGKKVTYLE